MPQKERTSSCDKVVLPRKMPAFPAKRNGHWANLQSKGALDENETAFRCRAFCRKDEPFTQKLLSILLPMGKVCPFRATLPDFQRRSDICGFAKRGINDAGRQTRDIDDPVEGVECRSRLAVPAEKPARTYLCSVNSLHRCLLLSFHPRLPFSVLYF